MSKRSETDSIQLKINQLYHLDKEETELRAGIRAVSEKIRALKSDLLKDIKENQLEKRPFVIGDRMIKYKIVKDTENLTQKYLKQTLNRYFETNPIESKNLFDFIISSRNTKYLEVIDLSKRPTHAIKRANSSEDNRTT